MAKKKNGAVNKLLSKAKIDRLPTNVRESVPFRGVLPNGIIESYAGTFTKSYRLKDVNFQIAPPEEQAQIYGHFMELLNSFSDQTKWQFTIFNHMVDKKETIENIRILPQRDGLNKYRQEMNKFLLDNLVKGNNSICQEKFLTVAVDDTNVEHAASTLRRIDSEVSSALKKITKSETMPMTTMERLKTLYTIYNQDTNYRFPDDLTEEKTIPFMESLAKQGLSVKDAIGPAGINYGPRDYFMFGDTYGRVFYLDRVPAYVKTTFLSDVADIQGNLLISLTTETTSQEEALKMMKNRIADIEGQIAQKSKSYADQGYLGSSVNPELSAAQEAARDLMNDVSSRDQGIFFMTMLVVVFAETRDMLEETSSQLKTICAKHMCPMKPVYDQQEFGINMALPLCRNDLMVERMYTTEGAAVFIPFNSQEINQKNAIFYGLNQTTKSMIICDRLSGSNYNGLIFGYSGSGKSFTAKAEMVSVLLNHPDAQVFVIDPQGEYYPMANKLGGSRIIIAPGSNIFINPLDLDLASDEDMETDPITMKSDYVLSMLEIMMGKNRQIEPACRSIVDRCIRKIYKPYIEHISKLTDGTTCDPSVAPTLADLYQEFRMQGNMYADQLADILELYAVGSFNTFAHRTNVKTDARFVVYDTKSLGSGMKELGLHVCINDIWNRMISNSRKHIYTWMYIDEFHVLLQSAATTVFLKQIWKMARKWLGVPTGIMQNTEDLLRDADSRAIVNNTSFIIMLTEPQMDRQNLAVLLNLSDSQLDYITNAEPGTGLLYNGKIVLPFMNKFPKDTQLYAMMTTAHDVQDAEFG